MAYKNAKITRGHVAKVVRKAWRLYFQWEQTKSPVDEEMYRAQRVLAENAVKAAEGQPWQKEMQLP